MAWTKRYLIFGLLGPFIGGFLLLIITTWLSGYWSNPNSEVARLFSAYFRTLQFSYLFGIIPSLLFAAFDDIMCHVERIGAMMRMWLVGAIAFLTTAFLYGSQGANSGIKQFLLFGLVGLIPALIASALSHKIVEAPTLVQTS